MSLLKRLRRWFLVSQARRHRQWLRENRVLMPSKIRTTFEYPPIPIRDFDWSAVDDDTYDVDCDQDGYFSHCPIGRGRTESEAVADLIEQIKDRKHG